MYLFIYIFICIIHKNDLLLVLIRMIYSSQPSSLSSSSSLPSITARLAKIEATVAPKPKGDTANFLIFFLIR